MKPTTSLDLRADRHFRPDPQQVLKAREEALLGRVLLAVDDALAPTHAGQHLSWMLTNLLARQFGVVAEIALDVPNVPLLEQVALFGTEATLRDSLYECVERVAGHHVKCRKAQGEHDKFDVAIFVGKSLGNHRANRTWHVYADGWRWYVGYNDPLPTASPSATISFGPYMAAAYAAGEIFKYLRGLRPNKGEFISESFGSVWDMELGDSWESLSAGPDLENIPPLPHFYFAGAGAVAQAAGAALGTSGIKGQATTVDDDTFDVTNDNRYVLTTAADDHSSKVELLAKFLTKRSIPCHPVPLKWANYVGTMGQKAATTELAALEKQYRYPLVLSCVDKNPPRHEIQNLLPSIILGASTDGLVAKAQVFDLGQDVACLKCHNPLEDRDAILKKNRDILDKMSANERIAWCSDRGIDPMALDRFLAPPGCGKLTEADLERFAKDSPEMSVGFVSLAAGVLLSAQLVRLTVLGPKEATAKGNSVMATFAKAGLRSRRIGAENGCDCLTRLRKAWPKLWGPV